MTDKLKVEGDIHMKFNPANAAGSINLLKNPGFEGERIFVLNENKEIVKGEASGWIYMLEKNSYIRSEAGEGYSYWPIGQIDVHGGSDACLQRH